MLKSKIQKLRESGCTYSEIAKKLKCSKSVISYHTNEEQRESSLNRQRKRRNNQHPFVRKMETFLTKNKSSIVNDTKSTAYKLLYTKLWVFCMRKTPTFTVQDIINKFGEKPICYLTGEEIDIYDTKSYEFDHIIPRSRGGSNTLDNLGICTKKANKSKHDMTPEEFLKLCKQIVKFYKP